MSWFIYPFFLFFFSLGLGIVSVIAGIGGGSIFVPVVASFTPFSFDFIRGAGLFVTLGSSLSASHRLIDRGLAHLRLALPYALSGSLFSVAGAYIGLMADDKILKILLGIIMIGLSGIMISARYSKKISTIKEDFFSKKLKTGGEYTDPFTGKTIQWKSGRTVVSFVIFAFIGLISGIFGMGAGWAGVPVLNTVSGAPIMIAAGTSNIIVSANATAAIWVYIERKAILPLIAIPSFFGVFIGSKIGVRIMHRVNPKWVRYAIIGFLLVSGINLIISNTAVLLAAWSAV